MPETLTDTGTTDTDGDSSGDTSPATDKPITMTSQQLAERLARAKPADYEDLQAKASKLDELEAANRSEIEKVTESATTATAERDAARAEALRLRVAVAHSISTEDADLFLTGTTEETLTAQAKRLSERGADRKTAGNFVPNEGRTPPAANATGDPASEFARFMSQPANG